VSEGLFLFLGVVAAVGVVVYLGLKAMAARALGVQLLLQPDPVPLTGAVSLELMARPSQQVKADKVVARLRCLRRYSDAPGEAFSEHEPTRRFLNAIHWMGSGHHHRHRHVEQDEVTRCEVEVSGPAVFEPGKLQRWAVELPVPEDGLPTDPHGPLTIRWVVEVQFFIPNFPDAVFSRPVRVVRR
jgi:hypothetical protein